MGNRLHIARISFAGLLALVALTATMATTSIITPQLAFGATSYTVIDQETCEALPSVY
jgi:hypothetical protein